MGSGDASRTNSAAPATGPARAAVVLLWRADGSGALELFWARRSPALRFLPGQWAFPGGRVEDGETVAMAAARELAEETGVSLALTAFAEAGRTVTPPWAPMRFDATYYLAQCPPGVEPDVTMAGGELVAGEWIRPAAALAAWERGDRITSPVVAAALAAMRDRGPGRIDFPEDESRIWDLVPGVAVALVRTPTLPPATHTNVYVVGADELVVIDPASPYPEERAALDEALTALAAAGRRVREIWLTHHHVDHVSGAVHLADRLGVPICAHPLTARLLEGRVPVARWIEDGEVTVFPGARGVPERRTRAVFTPGHAPGHLAFLEETTGLCVAGDMVAAVGTIIVDPDDGDMRAYLDSLRRLRDLEPRALLPAHGPAITEPRAKLDEYVAHRLRREASVEHALRAHGAAAHPRDLVAAVYDDTPPALHALAARSLEAHLVKLVADGRARRDGDAFVAR